MSGVRAVRMCDVCGGVDDHPRHVFAYANGTVSTSPGVAVKAMQNAGEDYQAVIMAQIQDSSTVMRHMDCCREVGCPDGTCDFVTAGAENLHGEDLLRHLTQNSAGDQNGT